MLSTTRRELDAALLGGGAASDPALVDGGGVVTYGELAGRAEARLDELGLRRRSLVVLSTVNTVEAVVTYVALLRGGHVPLLAPGHGDRAQRLGQEWRADAVVDVGPKGVAIDRSPARTEPHDLHPQLALVLSTSGSTGSPKLVRLSHDNLVSNAVAIREYLRLGPTDRAITTLPLHYCYGLSVLHSHLVAGGSIVLTEASVVDPCFADALAAHEITNVAGVPHTFDLLERAGPARLDVPSMRFVTQAGGRLPPERVAAWARRLDGWGIDLYVMYGQTEATARMAYLPPELVGRRPGSIGREIPGGSLALRPVAGRPDGVGELVYRGPNVMLGYASEPADLALGATLGELATGDLARFHPDDGVYEIVGRASRFVKPFGLRIDLDAVEASLRRAGIDAAVAGTDDVVAVGAPGADQAVVLRHVVDQTGLPARIVAVDTGGEIPRTATGKVDHAALLRATRAPTAGQPAAPLASAAATAAVVFADVLGRRDVAPSSTFVSLGGDSLSYVECSVRLEQALGHLPADWHLLPVRDLDAVARRGRLRRLDISALLRTLGICAVVATHMGLWYFPGGSHLMLAVVGYNLSRFHLPIAATAERLRAGLRAVRRVAIPTVAWVAACMVLVGGYGVGTLALVNNYVGPEPHVDGRWHYWFIEAFVQLTLLVAAILCVPAVRRFERRATYLFPLLLLGGALLFRYHWLEIHSLRNLRFRTHGVAWFFVLGWLAHASTTVPKRMLTTALCVLTIPGFFHRPEREWFIALGIIALTWLPAVPLPRLVLRPVAVIAAASMWIYISHFRIWPPLDRNLPSAVAYALTLAAGVAIWWAAEALARLSRPTVAAIRDRHPGLAGRADDAPRRSASRLVWRW